MWKSFREDTTQACHGIPTSSKESSRKWKQGSCTRVRLVSRVRLVHEIAGSRLFDLGLGRFVNPQAINRRTGSTSK